MNQPEGSLRSSQLDEECEKDKRVNPELEGKLSTQVEEILTKPTQEQEKKEELVKLFRSVSTQYSGPLPPPGMVRQYDEIVPGSADRIIKMAEKEQEHRHMCDRKEIEITGKQLTAENGKVQRGQWMGFGIAGLILALSTFLIVNGHPIEGSVLASVDLVALVAIFVLGKEKNNNTPPPKE